MGYRFVSASGFVRPLSSDRGFFAWIYGFFNKKGA